MSTRKLLIDACVAPTVARLLAADGHDVAPVHDMGPDPGGLAILERAAAEARTIITMDSDFGTLVFRDQQTRVGVLRLRESPPTFQAARARHWLGIHGEALEAGALVVDDGLDGRISLPA